MDELTDKRYRSKIMINNDQRKSDVTFLKEKIIISNSLSR